MRRKMTNEDVDDRVKNRQVERCENIESANSYIKWKCLKCHNNWIAAVKKVVTDAKSLEDVKNPDEDNVFKLYSLVANQEEIEEMRANYLAGGYGYGHAKNALHAILVREFKEEREKFEYYMNHIPELEQKLQEGEAKAEIIAKATIQRIRKKMNFDD